MVRVNTLIENMQKMKQTDINLSKHSSVELMRQKIVNNMIENY